MRVGRVLVAIILASASTAGQIPATPSTARSYADVIEFLRAGQDQAAIDALGLLTFQQVATGRDRLVSAFERQQDQTSRVAADVRLAALLHTAYAFRQRAHGRGLEFRNQIDIALAYIEKLAARDRTSAFVRTWWLMVIAFLHQQFAVVEAKEFAARARGSVGDSPDLYLAMGATEELEWTQRHEADGSSSFKGDLKEAERAYRNALAAQPDLVEARLRLGRVLTLRGEPEALKVLEQIRDSTDEGFLYLARLFEGDAFERQGDLAAAERQYLAAIPLLPTAQSAHLALAHVRHVMGARTKAAAEMRITTQDRVTGDTADPWFWYARGMFWHANVYLDALLRFARQ